MQPANRFDTRRFIAENFDTAKGVVNFVQSWRLTPPNVEAVSKWMLRGKVSAEWLPVLLVLLELEHGQPISLTRYVEVGGGREGNP